MPFGGVPWFGGEVGVGVCRGTLPWGCSGVGNTRQCCCGASIGGLSRRCGWRYFRCGWRSIRCCWSVLSAVRARLVGAVDGGSQLAGAVGGACWKSCCKNKTALKVAQVCRAGCGDQSRAPTLLGACVPEVLLPVGWGWALAGALPSGRPMWLRACFVRKPCICVRGKEKSRRRCLPPLAPSASGLTIWCP